ncbi:MAG: TIM-barrel domain-containing protein [Streptosporangiaceae bacterium]|jgi:alpha-glucosidase (family GH31 glycosyl hydrolase)
MHLLRATRHRSRRTLIVLGTLAVAALSLLPAATHAVGAQTGAATTDTSPVNLSAKIDMRDGKAKQNATVIAGDARFEVLAADVIRLEYAPDGKFLNQPTFNVLDRNLPVPRYTVSRTDGWLTIKTSGMVLSYQLGSGPFSTANTKLQLPGKTVTPSWEWECTYGQVCQSGAATLTGDAALATNHNGYVSPAGFVAGYSNPGDDASWQVLGSAAGPASVTIRYSNYIGAIGGPAPRTMTLVVNGDATQVTLPPTSSWDDWSTITVPVTLQSGTNAVAVDCATGDDCNVNVDDVAVTAPGATAAPVLPAGSLGGYIRSFDSANGTYTSTPSCSDTSDSDANCDASIPAMSQGLLDTSGWYLLDDTQTAVWTADGWIAPRPAGDLEDGYLFGYGQDYTGALRSLAALTGNAPLPPEYVFGNWFSRYYPYTADDYENQLLPEFEANDVSLDTLSVDTDWKSPNEWDGWEWNPALFPDPQAFLAWAKSQGIHVTLNIHSSVSTSDPEYALAQAIAGGTLAASSCNTGPCAVWDWSQIPQAESNFALQQPIQNQGVSFWWLDWCCDGSDVSMPGVTPDSWINHLYAQDLINGGQRGFVLARIGASLEDSVAGTYPAGAWADHRSAIAFTGDTWSTWNTLAMEAQLASDEGSIGEPYVSDDIGGFLGPPAGTPNDPDDLYLRWLQLGTFQPIMREHSNAGQNPRLPWEYDAATQATGDAFLQLRESLVPYLYTLAEQASSSGLPMTRALYLDYPGQAAAYQNPTEYLLGSDMLVAPVTTPGDVATTSVWFPPGRWTDWFTGATFTGPSTQTLSVPLNRMPVFVKAGGIVPLQSSSGHAATAGSAPLTLRVFAGSSGRYTMYDDAGTGLGYQHGQYSDTPISYRSGTDTSTLVVGPARGSYPGAPASRQYTVDLVDVSSPNSVLVDGQPVSGWSYSAATHTLQVPLGSVPVGSSATVTQVGGTPVQAVEPAATQLTISPADSLATASGATTTVSTTLANSGPDAVNGISLSLNAPSGWTVTPTTPTTAASLPAGSSLTASWSVTAPAGSGPQTATLSAAASYTDAATGQPVTVTAQQQPIPAITTVSPSTASAGQLVTVTGVNFGATQGSSYITFSDDGTNWGAPPDVATFSLNSWSDNQITFTVPSPSGPGDEYYVVPGSTATVTVTTAEGASNTGEVTIGS